MKSLSQKKVKDIINFCINKTHCFLSFFFVLFTSFLLFISFCHALPDMKSIRIVSITDGDTMKAVVNKRQIKIRLYGIDAPEKAQPFGQESTKYLMSLTKGKSISMRIMDKDQYGRIVALVYSDGRCLNEEMIKAGYAWVYTQYYKKSLHPEWKKYEYTARKNKKGLWKEKNPTAPWEWRKQKKERDDTYAFEEMLIEFILRIFFK